MYYHFVARALPGRRPLEHFDTAQWLWRRLRASWPQALSVCLMPNHLHGVLATDTPDCDRIRLARVLGALTRRQGLRRLWEPIPHPQPIPPKQLARVARYVALNPCRAP